LWSEHIIYNTCNFQISSISSGTILSGPGALLFFSFLMVLLTSLYVGGHISTSSFRFFISASLSVCSEVSSLFNTSLKYFFHLSNTCCFSVNTFPFSSLHSNNVPH